jgi:hypothetical protein
MRKIFPEISLKPWKYLKGSLVGMHIWIVLRKYDFKFSQIQFMPIEEDNHYNDTFYFLVCKSHLPPKKSSWL